jgi:hypothetical protein
MKTLLIDPHTRTITEHEYDGSLEAMYKLLNCGLVQPVYRNDRGESMFPGQDCLFVDEEGLLCDLSTQAFFIINGKPIAGRAITVGCDDEGETIEARITADDLEALDIQWVTLAELQASFRT